MAMEDVMRVDYVEKIGTYEIEMTALYNRTNISEKEVKKLIREGEAEISNCILVMTRVRFNNVFKGDNPDE